MRLLPDQPHLGWTPYAWLVYLAMPLLVAVLGGTGTLGAVLTFLGVAAFLVLYFLGYWLQGRKALPVVAGIVLLAVILSPFNWGATVFFIYGAAFLGQVGRPAVAFRYLAVILAVLAGAVWAFEIDPRAWIPAAVFSVIIGGVNIHFAEVGRGNARLRLAREEVERLATRAERERIARDLHDLLGHSLSLITLKAQLAARLAVAEPARAAEEMRQVEQVSRSALAEVRKAVQGYRLASLGTELSRARVALGTAGVRCIAEPGPFDLGPERENAAALALREAVTNVLRHARADTCTISWHQGPGREGGARGGGEFRLEIRDDGRGGLREEGSGLAGMRERIEELGGSVQRLSAEAGGRRPGTRIVVILPVRGEERPAVEAAVAG